MDRPLIMADDLQLFRQGLRDLLVMEGAEICGEACDGPEAVELAEQFPEAIMLLDIRLPGLDGFEVLAELESRGLPTRAIMLTAHWTNELLFRALCAGAAGYVAKDCAITELASAIDLVGQGGIALSSAVTRDFEVGIATTYRLVMERGARSLGLTDRELEILALLPSPSGLAQIAQHLFVSRKTVQNNVSTLYRKLGVTTRAEAVSAAVSRGLVAGPAPNHRSRSAHSSLS